MLNRFTDPFDNVLSGNGYNNNTRNTANINSGRVFEEDPPSYNQATHSSGCNPLNCKSNKKKESYIEDVLPSYSLACLQRNAASNATNNNAAQNRNII